jgi:hypothetical protein
MKRNTVFSAVACSLIALPVAAQTIERMRLTDGDLSCAQIYAEVQQMETMIRVMGGGPAPAGAPAAGAAPVSTPQADAFANSLVGLFGGTAPQPSAVVPSGLMPNQLGLPNALLADTRVQASVARARAAGYSDAQIAAMMQVGAARAGYPVGAALAAQGQVPLSAAAGGNQQQIAQNIVAQGQAYAGNVAAGQNWQNALANAQGAAPAAAPAPANNALGGLFGALAARGGVGGNAQAASLFGALAQHAQGGGQAPALSPAPAPVAQSAPQTTPATGNASAMVSQAQARKEHMTNLFLNKGCKMSEIQR